ncbi:hypothetical protein B0O99DRAFT_669981 [Bisporella sp. PMI_857]|nr:hypothetical protein B0O99DRAFT_669981 [Bisporella sp. PMI_857]
MSGPVLSSWAQNKMSPPHTASKHEDGAISESKRTNDSATSSLKAHMAERNATRNPRPQEDALLVPLFHAPGRVDRSTTEYPEWLEDLFPPEELGGRTLDELSPVPGCNQTGGLSLEQFDRELDAVSYSTQNQASDPFHNPFVSKPFPETAKYVRPNDVTSDHLVSWLIGESPAPTSHENEDRGEAGRLMDLFDEAQAAIDNLLKD